ncbi:hypothetical protein J7E83_17875 [Arthrobacter sp. ISL-48]|uniref:hypothetical protein n=1 Tax=Arthrobacter sp. ISL-48 TaxID=2819110 RepID=UPI001BE5B5AD|nr:hypothetical protein [Arthrobacter sp. ISL-48]MBT2533958.1 hypothetical protein [Arthrobacter sp. ISL-48]
MTLNDNGEEIRAQRVAHPKRAVAVVMCVLALLASAFLAGRFIGSPPRDAIQSAQQTIAVWSTVETRVVDNRLTFTGRVQPGTTVKIVALSETKPNVVVRQSLTPGARVEPGSLAGVVSGRPYFLLSGPLPLYRDLVLNDSGDDVLALQKSLATLGYYVELTSVVDRLTMNAISDIFAAADFELPKQLTKSDTEAAPPSSAAKTEQKTENLPKPATPYIPFRQLLLMPEGSGLVTSSAPIGAEVDVEKPLLTLRTTSSYVEFVAEVSQADQLKIGQKLTARVGPKEFPAVVDKIGNFQEGKDGTLPGKPVALTPAEAGDLDLPVDQPATIQTIGQVEEALSVPLIAVREDGSGHFVTKRSETREREPDGAGAEKSPPSEVRVSVSILRSGGGYVAISGDLHPGDQVKVS